MITELRRELRVSDDEHRELLSRVNADEIIHRIRYCNSLSSCTCNKKNILTVFLLLLLPRYMMDDAFREWRQTDCYQPARRTTSQPVHDILPSPTVSASRKKQKTTHSVRHLFLYVM